MRNKLRALAILLIFGAGIAAYGQVDSVQLQSVDKNVLLRKAHELFNNGQYESTLEELHSLEKQLTTSKESNRQVLGLVAYWKGITFNRLQNFPEAIKAFEVSLGYDYAPTDLHYEYGQALFAAERLEDARLQFRESIKRKFKRAVSLYYIGYISHQLGDRKKAYTFLKAISKFDDPEAKNIVQSAEFMIGNLYLEQVEDRSDAYRTVENYVIPQYQKALQVDEKSKLAPVIEDKVTELQRKYDLKLFQLRNGKPILSRPYLFRISEEAGYDSNVIFSPADTTIAESKQASGYSRTDFLGRYTFYHNDFLSFTPEFRFNYTYYFNRVPEVYRNDNYLLAPAFRTAYEHSLWNRPATFLLDYEYAEARRDVNAKKELEFSSRAHTLMIGERFNFFEWGESIVRLQYRVLESFISSADSSTTSLILEQVRNWGPHTLLFLLSYDRMRVEADIFDTDSVTFRSDLLMADFKGWFSPAISFAVTSTNPINDRKSRGNEILINPALRLSRQFGRSWRASLKYDYQKNNSKDEENFAYKKSVYALELEYLF